MFECFSHFRRFAINFASFALYFYGNKKPEKGGREDFECRKER